MSPDKKLSNNIQKSSDNRKSQSWKRNGINICAGWWRGGGSVHKSSANLCPLAKTRDFKAGEQFADFHPGNIRKNPPTTTQRIFRNVAGLSNSFEVDQKWPFQPAEV